LYQSQVRPLYLAILLIFCQTTVPEDLKVGLPSISTLIGIIYI
jgi:hypothetical protein